MRRIREIYKEAWILQESPKLYPVEEVHAISGLEFRRKNVGQFAIIYAYLEPTESEPHGVVSIRRVRHGAEQDVLLRVEERRAPGSVATHGLSTKAPNRGAYSDRSANSHADATSQSEELELSEDVA